MTHHLVVTKTFLNFVRGDVISEAGKVSEILTSAHKKFVTKIALSVTLKG